MGGQAERAAGGKVDGEMTVHALLFGARNNFLRLLLEMSGMVHAWDGRRLE